METMCRCSLCGHGADALFTAGDHIMYRCGACRTAFVSPVPTDEWLTTFYSRFHRSAADGGIYETMEDRMARDFPAKLRLVRGLPVPPSARLLDVGCGRGFFVQACLRAGLAAQGIDISDTAVRYARETVGVDATCGDVGALATERTAQYDIVTFWATVEHLPRPVETLRHIRRLLKPGGFLVMDTGAGDDLLERLLPGMTQWYDPPQHLFVFSERGIRMACESAGFTDVKVDVCFERSRARKVVRLVRNIGAATMLRGVCSLAGLRAVPPVFTRFPLGNLMSVLARNPGNSV